MMQRVVSAVFLSVLCHVAFAMNVVASAAPGAEFFEEPQIRLFEFDLSEAALNDLRRAPRSYVNGTVREGSQVLTNVGVHLRGNGSFRPLEEKPSFAVKFDHAVEKQTYRGLDKL